MLARRAFALAALVSLAAGALTARAEDLASVRKLVESGKATLVDVRELKEWDEGHLRDAKSLPLSALTADPSKAKELPKGKPVYTHCVRGVRARKAAEILKKEGLDARPLDEGYKELKEAGFADANTAR
jgi:rhodanese-related sulfurtransferase